MSTESTAGLRSDAELRTLVDELTVPEKAALVVGATVWRTTAVARIGLRSIVMSDGPSGVRGAGAAVGETSASFGAPTALAATWDLELAGRLGALFAVEARRHGVDVVLAPQVNLQRTPVAGRHFECYSEDPLLTGAVAGALVDAAQAHGVGMCAKHFVANDSETERTRYRARIDERTLREVYLAPFERLVSDVGVWSVMAAYNGLDALGTSAPATEHEPLLRGILRDEWGFDGLTISDWLATTSVTAAVRAGLDLQMPGPDGPWGDGLLDTISSGDLDADELDDKVVHLLRLAERVGALGPHGVAPPEAGHEAAHEAGHEAGHEGAAPTGAAALLREIAARAVVVLKDDDGLLPLNAGSAADEAATIALLGPAVAEPFVQGGGSAVVQPDRVVLLEPELHAALPARARLRSRAGARSRTNPPEIDAHGLCADPVTGEPGVRLELLDADGHPLSVGTEATWSGWLRPQDPRAATLHVSADIRLDEPGAHELGVGTVGRHDVVIDERFVSRSDDAAAEEIILSSGHNHPNAATIVVVVDRPRTVRLDARLQVVHPVGYEPFVRAAIVHRRPGPSAEQEMADAVALAATSDVAVIVVGTTEEVESEGFDRSTLALPGNQDELVRRVAAVNPRTVVIVNAGAPVLLPWYEEVGTVLWGWLGGQEGGGALADVLTGRAEPSGRLPWTLPARAEDVPVPSAVPELGVIDYGEGVDVGYRAWERRTSQRHGVAPAAPFGHGLGWATWEYEHASAHPRADGVDVAVTVRNTGRRPSHEVVQVYLQPPAGAGDGRPVRWLGGFACVLVGAGERVTSRVHVPRRAFETWDVARQMWVLPAGEHGLRIGRSVRDLRLELSARPTPADPSANTESANTEDPITESHARPAARNRPSEHKETQP